MTDQKKSSRTKRGRSSEDKNIDRTVRDAIDIDYSAEGRTPPNDDQRVEETDAGYDRAAHSGSSRFGIPEGNGGVFGTSGGGTYPSGFHVDDRSGLYDRSGEVPEATRDESARGRDDDRFDQVNLENRKKK